MSKKTEEKKVVEQFYNLIQIENAHRGIAVREELKNLKHQIDTASILDSLLPIMDLYVLLSNFGGTKQLQKKKQTDGRYYAKTWLLSQKIYDIALGFYKHKHGVHVRAGGKDLLSVVIHEILHYLTNQIYEDDIPKPYTPWDELKDALLSDLKSSDAEEYKEFHAVFEGIQKYKQDSQTEEVLPRLIEFILRFQQLPVEGFPKSADLFQKLFEGFLNDVKAFSKDLEQNIIEEKAISKLNLYQAISELDRIPPDELQKHIYTQRNMGFYPLHIAAHLGYLTLTKWLIENGKSQINELDKFGNNALHIALESNQPELAIYLIEQAPLELLFAKNETGKSVFTLTQVHCPKASQILMQRVDYMEDIRAQRDKGLYSLHQAALSGDLKLTKQLIEDRVVNIKEFDELNNNALHIALESNQPEVAIYYIEQVPLELLFSKNEAGKSIFKLAKDHCPEGRKALMQRSDYMNALMKSVTSESQLKQAADFFIEAITNAVHARGIDKIISIAKGAIATVHLENKEVYLQDLEQYAIIRKFALAGDAKAIQKVTDETIGLIREEKNPQKLDGIVGAAQIGLKQSIIVTEKQSKYLEKEARAKIYTLFSTRIPESTLETFKNYLGFSRVPE